MTERKQFKKENQDHCCFKIKMFFKCRSKPSKKTIDRWTLVRDTCTNEKRLAHLAKKLSDQEDYNFGLGYDITFYNSDEDNQSEMDNDEKKK